MTAMTVGLTGGIASGKSVVAKAFERRGVPIFDADRIAREVVAPGTPGLRSVIDAFGRQYRAPDGGLARSRLRRLVFGDSAARRRLEAIVHPLIRERLVAWRAGLTTYGVYSAALLIESRMREQVDRVLVIDAPETLQLARLMARDGIDEPLARAMIASQVTRRERLATADDVIRNHGPVDGIEPQVERLHRLYVQQAPRCVCDGPQRQQQ